MKDRKEKGAKLSQLPQSLKDFTSNCKDISKTIYNQQNCPRIMRNNNPLLPHVNCSSHSNGLEEHRTT